MMEREAILECILIVSGAFLGNFFVMGLINFIGVFQISLIEEFQNSNSVTSLVGAVSAGCFFAIGPLSGIIITKYGGLVTIIIGSVFLPVGIMVSAFSVNIYMMIASYGVITGCAAGLVFYACVATVNMKIQIHRSVFSAISIAGGAVGQSILPLALNAFIEVFGWRGSMLLLGGLEIHLFFACELIWIGIHIQDRRREQDKKRKILFVSTITKVATFGIDFKLITKEQPEKLCSIWKSPSYWSIFFSFFFLWFGIIIVYIHSVPYTKYLGYTSTEASSMASILGICNLIGKTSFGFVINHPKINSRLVYQICHFIMSIACIGFVSLPKYEIMITFMGIVGFFTGAIASPLTETLISIVGRSQFARAFGFMNVMAGIASVIGGPFAGWLYDMTSQYKMSFYVSAVSLFTGFLCLFVPLILRKRKVIKVGDSREPVEHPINKGVFKSIL